MGCVAEFPRSLRVRLCSRQKPFPQIEEFVEHPLGRELAQAARETLRSFPDGMKDQGDRNW